MKKQIQIKICGLTNFSDAKAALEAGADFLGFVLYAGSSRCISATALRRIAERFQGNPKAIGVFVNEQRDTVLQIASDCNLYAVQLHGDEAHDDFKSLEIPVWRSLRIQPACSHPPEAQRTGRESLISPMPEKWPAARYVVDAAVPGRYGGSGMIADWPAAADLAKRVPVMLAGGLTPDNVREAILIVQPLGVDIASGVEKAPGKKDYGKLKAFIKAVRKNDE